MNDTLSGNARPWTGKTMGTRRGYYGFFFIIRIFGRRCAGAVLVFVALFYYLFVPRARTSIHSYILQRFPNAGPALRPLLKWRRVLSFAEVLLDTMYLRVKGGAPFSVEFPDTQKIRDALAVGKGVIILSAHVGNWEVVGRFFGRLGTPVSVVVFENERPEIREMYDGLSRKGALPYTRIYSNDPFEAVLRIHESLLKKHIVVMHGDRALADGILLPFLGKPAIFPDSPYKIAEKTGAPIVCAFCCRIGHLRYRANALPHFLAGPGEEGTRAACGKYVSALEGAVGSYPFQWFNFYDFWKTHAI
jgi:predicted LPLAT superfamily acyltransferase